MKVKHLNNRIYCTIFAFFVLIILGTNTNAQVYYSYDNNGNRIADGLVVYAMQQKPEKKSNTPCNVAVYPNPTAGQVTVSIPCIQTNETALIYTSDGSGNVLSTQKTTAATSSLSLAEYNQGIYYVRIILGGDEYTYKVVKTTPGSGNTAPPGDKSILPKLAPK